MPTPLHQTIHKTLEYTLEITLTYPQVLDNNTLHLNGNSNKKLIEKKNTTDVFVIILLRLNYIYLVLSITRLLKAL
jgi:hypothetical protein